MPTNTPETKFDVSVSYEMEDGSRIKKSYITTQEDIDDMPWAGGNAGDSYFDRMEDDEQRFHARLTDMIELWVDESLGEMACEVERSEVTGWSIVE